MLFLNACFIAPASHYKTMLNTRLQFFLKSTSQDFITVHHHTLHHHTLHIFFHEHISLLKLVIITRPYKVIWPINLFH